MKEERIDNRLTPTKNENRILDESKENELPTRRSSSKFVVPATIAKCCKCFQSVYKVVLDIITLIVYNMSFVTFI